MEAITALASQEREEGSGVPDMHQFCTVPQCICCDDVLFFSKYESEFAA